VCSCVRVCIAEGDLVLRVDGVVVQAWVFMCVCGCVCACVLLRAILFLRLMVWWCRSSCLCGRVCACVCLCACVYC